MSLRIKLLLMVIAGFVVIAVGVLGMAAWEFNNIHDEFETLRTDLAGIDDGVRKIIDENMETIHGQQINSIAEKVQVAHDSVQSMLDESGLSGTDMATDYIKQAKDEILAKLRKDYYTGNTAVYPFIIDGEGKMIMHPNIEVGTDMTDFPFILTMIEHKTGKLDYEYKGDKKWMAFKHMPGWDWIVSIAILQKEKYKQADAASATIDNFNAKLNTLDTVLAVFQRNLSLFFVGVILLVSVVLAFLISAWITTPLLAGVQRLTEVAVKGDLSINAREEFLHRKDEIGQLAKAIQTLIESQRNAAKMAERLAQGDWSAKVSVRSEKDQLNFSLRTMVEQVNQALHQVQGTTEQVNAGSSEIANASQNLSQGATSQASSLEEIASSMTELAGQTNQNAENAQQANRLAQTARESAETGNTHMKSMVEAMSEISASSQQISQIIKTIDDIAFQTNLLALNAAVEAARAGRHGKGFAVVAEEVRNLAGRSAKAARETATLIETSVQKVSNGTAIAEQTATSLGEIVEGVTKVTDLIGEIAAASNEQAQGIAQINQGLTQVEDVTQRNTASAEQAAAAASELSSQAEELRRLLAQFTLTGQEQDSAIYLDTEVEGGENASASHPCAPPLPSSSMQDNRLLPSG